MVEHLVQFQRGLGSSPGLVTFHAAIKQQGKQKSLMTLKGTQKMLMHGANA